MPEAKGEEIQINCIDKGSLRKAPHRLYPLVYSHEEHLNKHSKLRKEKYKMHGSSNKEAPGSGMELNPVFKDIT